VIGVVLPSHNESDNIAALATAIRAAVPAATIVVIDDWPDLATVEALAPRLGPSLQVIHRHEGIDVLLAASGDAIVEMDADFSHAPAQIPRQTAALDGSGVDMVMASRYMPGDVRQRWPRLQPPQRACSRGSGRAAARAGEVWAAARGLARICAPKRRLARRR